MQHAENSKPARVPVQFSNIPEALKEIPHWLLWKWALRDAKWTKPPFQTNEKLASVKDSSTWAALKEVKKAYESGKFDGIGFAGLEDTDFVGVDLDHCQGEQWALDIIDALESYTELTPGGDGYRVWIEATKPENMKCKSKDFHESKVEVYDSGRFFTITGDCINKLPIERRQAEFERVMAPLITAPTPAKDTTPAKNTTSTGELTRYIEKAKEICTNFDTLFNNPSSGDHSAEDMALCNHLAFITGRNENIMDALFRRSALMRMKWDSKRGDNSTYGKITIGKAIESTRNVYEWGKLSKTSYEQNVVSIRLPDKPPGLFHKLTIKSDFDPEKIPPREFLIVGFLLKKYLNILVSPGGVGKSILVLVEAVSVATGRDLLGFGLRKRANVLLINNEDDTNEIERRIAAICKQYDIKLSELENRLFYYSGYEMDFMLTHTSPKNDIELTAIATDMIKQVEDDDIELISVDPFVSTHDTDENNNSDLNKVAGWYKKIAAKTGAAIRIVHHTRKANDSESFIGDVDSARGGKALTDSARLVHTFAPMTDKHAKESDIDKARAIRLRRIDLAKSNFSIGDGKPSWFEMKTVVIGGEEVGVPVKTSVGGASKTAPESSVAEDICHCLVEKIGLDGGKCLWTELRGMYLKKTGYARSTADDKVTTLAKGQSKSRLVMVRGSRYKIWYEKGDKRTSPIYVHFDAID